MSGKTTKLKAVPTQPAVLVTSDPDSLLMADVTTKGMKAAMTTAVIIIGSAKGRKINRSDLNALTTAGMSGWDSAIFAMVGDEQYNANVRGKAMRTWLEKRPTVVAAARKMAEALIG